MPNHFHSIIYLKPDTRKDELNSPLHENYKNKFGPQRNNIPSIIRGFKSACTSQIKKSGIKSFGWQKGYYDHIIRSQKSLIKIEEYIRKNPLIWQDDCYYQ